MNINVQVWGYKKGQISNMKIEIALSDDPNSTININVYDEDDEENSSQTPHRKYPCTYKDNIDINDLKVPKNPNPPMPPRDAISFPSIPVIINSNKTLSEQDIKEIKDKVAREILKDRGIVEKII